MQNSTSISKVQKKDGKATKKKKKALITNNKRAKE